MHDDPTVPPNGGLNRRRLLGAIGAGAGATAVGAAGASDALAQTRNRADGRGRPGRNPGPDRANRFTRVFNDLPPFAEPTTEVIEALRAIGAPGGIMDAGDDLTASPVDLATDPALSVDNPDHSSGVAGMTFVGQFIDHDLTRDAGSTLGQPTPLRRSTNLRTPRFDLDSVYGGGPEDAPNLYAPDRVRLRLESSGLAEDVPRDDSGQAIIGDPRNDENLMVSGFHAALIAFHNACADRTEGQGFAQAARLARWHWHWIVVHEVLPAFVGQAMTDDVLATGPQFFTGDRIPIEFQTAAYRFGHSMVRPSYLANRTGNDGAPFGGLVFDPNGERSDDPDDLSGGHRAPRRFIGWEGFFDFGDGSVQHHKRLDTTLSSVLFRLPLAAIDTVRGEPVGPTSLASRNLLRHLTWQVPSGQRIAAEMGLAPLSRADLSDLEPFGNRLQTSTPLWFYVLREADLLADGAHLGPVGGRIVAEVFISLLRRDAGSWLRTMPDWTPTLPMADPAASFRMTDLLRVAGVDPDSRATA